MTGNENFIIDDDTPVSVQLVRKLAFYLSLIVLVLAIAVVAFSVINLDQDTKALLASKAERCGRATIHDVLASDEQISIAESYLYRIELVQCK